jgi:hypothetical protein
MSPKATVIVVAATGNVLGVVSHEGDPERGLPAAAVAGDSFPIRKRASGDVIVDVPVDELATSAVPVVDDLLKTPQQCVVADGAATLGKSANVGIDIDAAKIRITGAAQPSKDVEVRVFVEHGQGSDRQRAVFKGKLGANKTTLDITATFDPDDYDLVAAVPGTALATLSKTVT